MPLSLAAHGVVLALLAGPGLPQPAPGTPKAPHRVVLLPVLEKKFRPRAEAPAAVRPPSNLSAGLEPALDRSPPSRVPRGEVAPRATAGAVVRHTFGGLPGVDRGAREPAGVPTGAGAQGVKDAASGASDPPDREVPADTAHGLALGRDTALLAELPSYAAQLPAPFVRHYRLSRGPQRGAGEWAYRHEADGRYVLSLVVRLQQGAPWLELHSAGVVDGEQLRPQRASDRRRGRGVQAASFDAAAGLVRFSGQAPAQPLLPVTQDRLSWLVQLPAIVRANPALARADQRVLLHVAGARGDVAVWVFESRGIGVDASGPGRAGTVHLVREATQPYDTRAEVWLDPAREYLPRAWRLTPTPTGAALEAELDEAAGAEAAEAAGPLPARPGPAAAGPGA